MGLAYHRHHRLHLRGHPSRRHPGHRLHLRRRLLQARRRLDLRRHHRQQEPLGLRLQQVHHPVVYQRWVHPAYHAQHELDLFVVQLRDPVLLYWKEMPQVESQEQRAQHVDHSFFASEKKVLRARSGEVSMDFEVWYVAGEKENRAAL